MTATKRVGFTYNSEYWQTLADVSAYLEEQDFEPDEDFIFRDSGHTLEIDSDAHFEIKEFDRWQDLADDYERVGSLVIRRMR
jgi:hypothetical protein